jgi:hydroxypyruvate isomerase
LTDDRLKAADNLITDHFSIISNLFSMAPHNRRSAIKNLVLGGTAVAGASAISWADKEMDRSLKGNINHSVCQWTYNFIPLEELCQAVKKIGFSAIDLIAPKDWPMLQKYGIYSSMCYIGGKVSLTEGWNNKNFHEQLIKDYLEVIPLMVRQAIKM